MLTKSFQDAVDFPPPASPRHRVRRIVVAIVVIAIIYAVAWGVAYARLGGLDDDNNAVFTDASVAYGIAQTLQEQLGACPAAAGSSAFDDGENPLDSRPESLSSHISPAVWSMVAQNRRIQAVTSRNLAAEARLSAYSASLLETMHANGCRIHVEGSVTSFNGAADTIAFDKGAADGSEGGR